MFFLNFCFLVKQHYWILLPSNIIEFYRSRTRWIAMQVRHELSHLNSLTEFFSLYVFFLIFQLKGFGKSISCHFKNIKMQCSYRYWQSWERLQKWGRTKFHILFKVMGGISKNIFPLEKGFLFEGGIFAKILAIHLSLNGV